MKKYFIAFLIALFGWIMFTITQNYTFLSIGLCGNFLQLMCILEGDIKRS